MSGKISLMTVGAALITTFIWSAIIQTIFFAFAAYKKSDKVTDLSYSLSFVILAIWLFTAGENSLFRFAITSMVVFWGIRLGAYLFMRILAIKKDARFDGIRENFWAFAKFWTLQGIGVWLILIPTTVALSRTNTVELGFISIVGVVMWVIGLTVESFADAQKFMFYQHKEISPTPWIEKGLWKYSRHPNYFGELLVWWGIFIAVTPALLGWTWLSIVGPLSITGLLLFVTGIPTVRKSMDKKFGDDPRYKEYLLRTRLLIPLPK